MSEQAESGETIPRPIFIIAPHRSGTTLLYRILCRHPHLAFFTRSDKRFPGRPRFAHALARMTGSGDPVEAQPVWDRFKGSLADTMGSDQATPEVLRWYRSLVGKVCDLRGTDRFVAKYPRLSLRIPWLETIFPEAHYVHIKRDWRAVVNSTVARKQRREDRGGGWFGVYVPGWRNMSFRSHPESATRTFIHVTRELENQARSLGPRYLSIQYETLCQHPVETVNRVLDHCGLAREDSFLESVPRELVRSQKWKRDLSPERVRELRELDAELLSRYEFDETESTGSSSVRPRRSLAEEASVSS